MDTVKRRLGALLWGSPVRAVIATFASVGALGVAAANIPQLSQFAVWVFVSSPLALLALAHPNETKQVLGRSLSVLASLHHRLELEAVRQDLEGTLAIGAERLRQHTPEGIVPNLRLDYLRTEGDIALLPDGTVVVGIAQHENRDRNLVGAAWAFAQHGLLAESRPYLDHDVSVGLDLVLAKELLEPAGTRAIAQFLTSVWKPSVVGRDRLRELAGKLEVIQNNRLLGPIAISEFHELASSLGFRFPTEVVAEETAAFVDYLYEIACREPGANLGDRSNFEGNSIRCRILYTAKPDIYAVRGPGPHRGAIDWAIRRAYHRVYLLAMGPNESYVREVLEPYNVDQRVRAMVEFADTLTLRSGRPMRQFVFRISIDVRYHVGIGQRPIVAVGPGASQPERSRRDRSAAG